MRKIFIPQKRAEKFNDFIQNYSEIPTKLKEAIIELRRGTRLCDHKLKKVKFNNIWITDIGGRVGGRGIYISEGNRIILWGVSKGHEIEDEADRFFKNCSENEFRSLTEDTEDITYEFLTEEEENALSERHKIFAENLSDKLLKNLGLNDHQIGEVRKSNMVSIWNIKAITPGMKFRLITLMKTPEGTILKAMDDNHFKRFINGDVSRLLIHTDEYQTSIISERVGSDMLIKGETGSGKTTILIYKAVYAAEQNPDKKYILFTFNIALANLITESVEDLMGKKIRNLEIHGFLEWSKDILEVLEYDLNILQNNKEINNIIKLLYTEMDKKVLNIERSNSMNNFLRSEIEEIILDHGIDKEQEYLIISRYGRKKKLGKNQRRLIWGIYLKFKLHLEENGLITYKAIPLLVNKEIFKRDFGFRKDGVFVDEVQDMSPIVLRSLSALKKSDDSYAVFAGDYKQAIYRKSFRWKDIGLPFKGKNVRILKRITETQRRYLMRLIICLKGLSRMLKNLRAPEEVTMMLFLSFIKPRKE